MAKHGKLPTYMTMAQVLEEFFLSGVYVDFPINCRCGVKVDSFAGVSIHSRKAHGIYIKKDRGAHKKHKQNYVANHQKEKKGDGLPTFTTKRSMKNTLGSVHKKNRYDNFREN